MKKQFRSIILFLIFINSLTISGFAQQPAFKRLDPRVYEPFLGSYQFKSGETVVIGRSVRRLFYFEPATGLVRGLAPFSDSTDLELKWSAGPSLLVLKPATFQIVFTKNKAGEITQFVLKQAGKPDKIAKRLRLYTEEEVTFNNADVKLAGKLLLPNTKGPHPAVILLHGSGPQDRNGERSEIRWVADNFARHGIAALIFDKRGFAGSTGNLATATFRDFAADALAGIKMLQGRKEIDPKQIGMWGVSQAGWVMTTATSMSKDIAFIISVSAGGSGYTVAQQNNYNISAEMLRSGFSQSEVNEVIVSYNLFYDLVRAGSKGDGTKLDNAIQQLLKKNSKLSDWVPPQSNEINWKERDQWFLALDLDFDPTSGWEQYAGPVLGIFGELDSSTPVQQVVPIMSAALAKRKNTDFAIKIFPGANHNIMQAVSGSDSELPNLDHFFPEFLNTMTKWLLSKVKLNK